MPNLLKRKELLARSAELRQRAEATLTALVDGGLREQLAAFVIRPLDDVDGFFLGDPDRKPSVAANEDMWLRHAELALLTAEGQYLQFTSAVEKYGGPANVVTFPKQDK